MTRYDHQYRDIIRRIKEEGEWDYGHDVRTKYADGTPAYRKSILNQQIVLEPQDMPFLTTKKTGVKTLTNEMLWIYQDKSNIVQDLRDRGVKIWNEWENEWGTIGPAYGHQVGKRVYTHTQKGILVDQMDHLLTNLQKNPKSTRHIISLWNIEDLEEMMLAPCVWNNQWQVWNGQLHLTVQCRSNDMALGNPYNIAQYVILQEMVAQVTGYESGTFTYNIANAHYYDRHEEDLLKQVEEPTIPDTFLDFSLNDEIENFYQFSASDVSVVGLQGRPPYSYEIAI